MELQMFASRPEQPYLHAGFLILRAWQQGERGSYCSHWAASSRATPEIQLSPPEPPGVAGVRIPQGRR